jgi:hypothetical protein
MTVPYSPPVLTTYQQTDDWFAVVQLDAPEFRVLRRSVNQDISLQMVIETLQNGIARLIDRTKREEAQVLLRQCAQQVDTAYGLFTEGKDRDAILLMNDAYSTFREAGKARSAPKQA